MAHPCLLGTRALSQLHSRSDYQKERPVLPCLGLADNQLFSSLESIPYIGEILALGSAVSWSGAVIFFKKSGESMPPMALNLFKNFVALPPLILTVYFLGQLNHTVSATQLWLMFFGGVVGIAVADSFFFAALERLGAGRSAILNTLYSPIFVVLAFLIWGNEEKMNGTQAFGGAMIVGGVLLATLSGSRNAPEIPKKTLVIGVLFEIAQLLLMGLSLIPLNKIIDDQPFMWAATIRLSGGTCALVLLCLLVPRYRKYWGVFRPQRSWRFSIPGSLLGTYVAMACWMGGFKYTDKVATAALLNQSSTIFTVIFAWIFLKEPLTRRRIVALTLALYGAAIVISGEGDPFGILR